MTTLTSVTFVDVTLKWLFWHCFKGESRNPAGGERTHLVVGTAPGGSPPFSLPSLPSGICWSVPTQWCRRSPEQARQKWTAQPLPFTCSAWSRVSLQTEPSPTGLCFLAARGHFFLKALQVEVGVLCQGYYPFLILDPWPNCMANFDTAFL